ncbi:MAG: alpha/beta hydrolase [Deltaproteobacteria bacterium]|nr:alpha/beta hydrolase [Deltaproteobacteria bacterium]
MRKTANLAGGELSYLETGAPDMPLVVCLHGFPDHPIAFEPLMGSLAEAGFRAVAPWLRGYAPSTTEGPYHLDRLVLDLVELTDRVAPGQRFALIGHDWGAAISYAAARTLGDRLSCAIALGVPHPSAVLGNLRREPGQLMRLRYMALFQVPRLSERMVWANDFGYIDELWTRWSPDYRMPESYRARLKSCLAASMPAPLGYYRALRSRAGLRAVRSIGREAIEQPFLWMHGDGDGCIGANMGIGQEHYFSGPFESEVVAGAGHFLPQEASRLLADRALAWLRKHWPRA